VVNNEIVAPNCYKRPLLLDVVSARNGVITIYS